MGANTKIQWADDTFNPVRGCTKISAGCANCYAARQSLRNPKTLGTWGGAGTRIVAVAKTWNEPLKWDREAKAAGVRRRVFCASLGDVFEDWHGHLFYPDPKGLYPDKQRAEGLTMAWYSPTVGIFKRGSRFLQAGDRATMMQDMRDQLFKLIEKTPNLDWLLLTKRPQNVMSMVPHAWIRGFPDNVWMGTSVEDQAAADGRIPKLLEIPARVRFLSCEPLLGKVDLRGIRVDKEDPLTLYWPLSGKMLHDGMNEPFAWPNTRRIHWVIAGGESGPGARRCDVENILGLVDQCAEAGVSCFVKQLGSQAFFEGQRQAFKDKKGGDQAEWHEALRVQEFPNGAKYNQF
jgi:protein gp37